MEKKKVEILTSIIAGKALVDSSYKEYINLKLLDNKRNIDLEYQSKLRIQYEKFQVDLCNYVRSIKDNKFYFEKFYKLENILNIEIHVYTFDVLFTSFRNIKTHYDKTNKKNEYKMYKENITFELLEKIYFICDELVDFEVKKLNENELIKFFMGNIDLQISFQKLINQSIIKNEEEKMNYPKLHELNKCILDELKNTNIENLTLKEIENILYNIRKYLSDNAYKNYFISNYGKNLYNELFFIFDVEISIEEYQKIIVEIIKKIKLKKQ